MFLFINLLGKRLTQEINVDRGSIWWAPGSRGNQIPVAIVTFSRFLGSVMLRCYVTVTTFSYRHGMRDYWTWFWHPKYGNCFTFNRGSDAQNKPIAVLMSSLPGHDAGTLMPPTPGSLSIVAIVFIVSCVCVSSLINWTFSITHAGLKVYLRKKVGFSERVKRVSSSVTLYSSLNQCLASHQRLFVS